MENEELSAYEIVMDENCDDNVVLYNTKNEPVEFEQVCYVPIGDRDFCILKPVVALDGMNEDEALVFELKKDEENDFVLVDEESIIDKVFDIYEDLLEDNE